MSTENPNVNTPEVDAFDIFNTNVEDIKSYEETSQYEKKDWSKIFFEPDPKAAGKELAFVIKFCPNIYDPRDPMPKHYTYKLPIPERPEKNFTWVSPSSVGKSCPVVSAYFDFKDSSDPRLVKISENLKRKRYKAAVIQILNSPVDPTLNGQFRLFKFAEGREIDQMIQKKMKPSEQDMSIGVEPVNVFDPFNAPVMILRVKQGEYGRDFTASEWAGNDKNQGIVLCKYDENGIAIDYKNSKTILHDADRGNKEYQKQIVELLKADNINLKELWMFHEPDEEYMNKCLKALELLKTGKISEISKAEASDDAAAETKMEETAKPSQTPSQTQSQPQSQTPSQTQAATPTDDKQKSDREKAVDALFND